MRQEPNNGIDLLLRQMGRRDESLLPELDGQHLDADELNSYVANALPAAARARYTRHLADCSSCRKIVATLSASEGVVAAKQPATVVAPSGLKSFLASLFSPMVLRYAVPALGVIIVAVIGIVVLRQERQGAFVAQVDETQTKSMPDRPAALATPTAPSANEASPAINELRSSEAPGRITTDSAKDAPAPAPTAEAQPLVAGAAPPPAKVVPAGEADQQKEAEKKKTETADENAPPRDARRADEAVKQEARKYDAMASAPAAVPGNKAPEPAGAKTESGAARGAGTGAVANFSREEEDRSRQKLLEKDAKDTETQTAGGRTFRKRGDVWIDTAYSYQATTNVARGSEQYRALVADEPGIHTIAETLKSEFIVVWKGRAYRIR